MNDEVLDFDAIARLTQNILRACHEHDVRTVENALIYAISSAIHYYIKPEFHAETVERTFLSVTHTLRKMNESAASSSTATND